MNSLVDTLLGRASHPAHTLEEPVPNSDQLSKIIACALSAPDHGKLRPWRFVVIQGDQRNQLGEALASAAKNENPDIDDEKLSMIKSKPLRSPMIITVVATVVEDLPKVPVFEQILSTGAAAQQLQLGANDLGFGCIWLSGPFCNSVAVKDFLEAAENDLVAGFIYIGTPFHTAPQKARPAVADHLKYLDK